MDTSRIKILIVEDTEEISTMYRLKFEKEGFIVKVSENGFDAVTHIVDFRPNVILLDIMMPSMDGFETLRVIRELAPSLDTKIIMFSNLNSKADIEKSMSLGADGYLLKANTTPKEAVEKVMEVLSMGKNQDSLVQKSEDGTPSVSYIDNKRIVKKCPHCQMDINIDINLK